MVIKTLDLNDFCNFLIEAKMETYAKDAPKSVSKCLCSKNYLYETGHYRYEDQYFGKYLDVGEEIVWFKGVPIWGRGYRGGMLEQYIHLARDTFKFLRKALCLPEYSFPVRGPKNLVENNFEYSNTPIGKITSFTGSENIRLNGELIYSRKYLGGIIIGKYNPNMQII